MRRRTILSLASLFVVLFTVSIWALPASPDSATTMPGPVPANQSASGRISAVNDAAFSLEVKKNQDTQTLQFLVDEDTKVSGKLEVGAQASVEYRTTGDRNIAVNVMVQPAHGLSR